MKGPTPKPPGLKLVQGNPGKRPIYGNPDDIEVREEPLIPPETLNETEQKVWDRFINTAWWLGETDVSKCYLWTCLQAEFQKDPMEFPVGKLTSLRVLGSDLGFDPGSRARLGVRAKKEEDPADNFFD